MPPFSPTDLAPASTLSLEPFAEQWPAVGFLLETPAGRFQQVGGATGALTGYARDELVAGGLALLRSRVHPDDWPALERRLRSPPTPPVSDGPTAWSSPYRIRHADGSWRWARTATTVVRRGPDGLPELIAGITIDVTAEAVAGDRTAEAVRGQGLEMALTRTVGEYRSLLETAREGIVTVDREFRITFANERFAEMVGARPPELVGRRAETLLPEQERPRFRERLRRRRAGLSEDYEVELGGTGVAGPVHCLVASSPILGADGSFQGALEMFTDITEQARTLERLRASETRFREFASHADQAMFIAAPDLSRVHWVAAAWERVSGFAGDALAHDLRRVRARLAEEDRPAADAWARRLLDGSPAEFEGRFRRADERQIWLGVRAFPIPRSDGRIHLIGGFASDVTARRAADLELGRSSERLAELVGVRTAELERAYLRLQEESRQRQLADRLLRETEKLAATGRMAARIAHEINNPLGGIRNAFRLVREAVPASHPHAHYAARIEGEIDRIAAIVRQMFDLYRPAPPEIGRVGLRHAVEDILMIVERSADERRLSVLADIDPAITLRQPESLVRPVLLNLIQNAIDASPTGGRVEIDAGMADGWVEIRVADQGPGVDPAIAERIFEPFFTTKIGLAGSGLGLGLSTARSLVDAMGGSLAFHPILPHGTCFVARLAAIHPSLHPESVE